MPLPAFKRQLGWMGKRAAKYFKKHLKRLMARQERMKAKRDPEAQPTYRKHSGYYD